MKPMNNKPPEFLLMPIELAKLVADNLRRQSWLKANPIIQELAQMQPLPNAVLAKMRRDAARSAKKAEAAK